jgi:hypothetical protein
VSTRHLKEFICLPTNKGLLPINQSSKVAKVMAMVLHEIEGVEEVLTSSHLGKPREAGFLSQIFVF